MITRVTRRIAPLILLALAALLALHLTGASPARADDNIFPPAPAAKAAVDFDGQGFLINGQRTFITSGSLHYPRVPHELWRDRLLRMKRAGFNTVQTYAFWNYHEPQEGHWNFTGDGDVDAFLKLVHELGMYAVVRVGPYVCAEWDSGGYPVWLRFKPGVRVREENPEFETAVDHWMEKIMPIVAANQIHRGGSVIFVQLENEHPKGWGRDMPNNYFRHLRDKALALGLEVPYWFSGLHHGSDPAGGKSWDSLKRTSPWYTSEFWPGWYSDYGEFPPDKLRKFDRGTWKIIAYGGNGYNYYMLHGGTDFSTWNDDEVASSYDYSGAIGQAGDLRTIYYRFKKAAWFARSMQDVLETSHNADAEFKDIATASGLHITARRAPAGAIAFVDNDGKEPIKTQFKIGGAVVPQAGPVTIAPGEIMPVLVDYTVNPHIKVAYCVGHILAKTTVGGTPTFFIYGPVGEPFEAGLVDAGSIDALQGRYGQSNPLSVSTNLGGHIFQVCALDDKLADHTWFIDEGKKSYIVCGGHYVGEAHETHDGLVLSVATPLAETPDSGIMVFNTSANGMAGIPLRDPEAKAAVLAASTLGSWQSLPQSAEAQPKFDDSAWKASPQPLQMGADGDISAYAWYRATVQAPAAGEYQLRFNKAADSLTTFINGQPANGGKPKAGGRVTVKVQLAAGDNTLAVLTAHYGRQKLFSFLGPIDNASPKGLAGSVTLASGAPAPVDGIAITHWIYRLDDHAGKDAKQMAAPSLKTDGADWKPAKIGEDVFAHRPGYAWFRTTIDSSSATAHDQFDLHFESVDDNATVYLNGQKLAHHEGWDDAFDVPTGTAWHANGPNVLAVLVQNKDGAGGIMGPVQLQSQAPGNEVTGWKMRGGIAAINTDAPPAGSEKWQPLTASTEPTVATAVGWPTWYRTDFQATPPAATGPHPIWRVSLPGMSAGFVWLNGHNLGRYPEKVHVDGLYLPECWLVAGKNALAIFDEQGKNPSAVHLTVEQAASRTVTEVVVQQK